MFVALGFFLGLALVELWERRRVREWSPTALYVEYSARERVEALLLAAGLGLLAFLLHRTAGLSWDSPVGQTLGTATGAVVFHLFFGGLIGSRDNDCA